MRKARLAADDPTRVAVLRERSERGTCSSLRELFL
jgi:hypothetical protein